MINGGNSPSLGGQRGGTRFRLFPQAPLTGRTEPETVWLSPPAGSLGPGPSDARMYVLDPIGKHQPYGLVRTNDGAPHLYLPPWMGPMRPPALPDEQGHFDHLPVGTREFEAAHAYGVVRFALDAWQRYFGRPIEWHFARDLDQLEISMLPWFDNARAGWGFLELGSHFSELGEAQPFSLNFDVIAHELGHLIIYSEVGLPSDDAAEAEYAGFHESAADLAALLAALHFESVVHDLLALTRGNLYTFNELSRFAELSENEEIRNADNTRKLSDFAAGWTDEHDLSEPLTGAIFDIFVDIFHESLLERRLIDPKVEDLFDQLERSPEYADVIQVLFDEPFRDDPVGFEDALLAARDYLGVVLASAWQRLPRDFLDYEAVGAALLEVDRELSGGRHERLILHNLFWRGIGIIRVGPRLAPPDRESHVLSARTLSPEVAAGPPRMSYRERRQRAGRPRLPAQ
jgi:hypothetical protein